MASREYNKKYYREHRQAFLDRSKKIYRDDPEAAKAYAKQHRLDNSEEINKSRKKYRLNNVLSISMQNKNWRNNNPKKWLLDNARKRAKKRGTPFLITEADIIIPKFCPVFGTKLEPGTPKSRANSPSLDCFVPELGYVPGNVFVISYRANTMKNDGSLEEHQKLVQWMEKQISKKEIKLSIVCGAN